MTRRTRGGSRISPPRRRTPAQAPEGLLDSFTAEQLEYWSARSVDACRCTNELYFEMEKQRVAHYDTLLEALRAGGGTNLTLTPAWSRITDQRWSLQPLSPAGSLKTIGGRFNIGEQLGRYTTPFPALYIGSNEATARGEKFGPAAASSPLSLDEFALAPPNAFTTFWLTGQLEHLFDLREPASLEPFIRIIAGFKLPAHLKTRFRKLNFPYQQIPSSVRLLARVLAPPEVWRREPYLVNVPATSQILARYIRAAGFQGILYPSQRGGNLCIAVFPHNIVGASTLQVLGTYLHKPPTPCLTATIRASKACRDSSPDTHR